MEVQDLSLDDMNPDRSTSKSGPTQQLRSAIEKYEIVIELVRDSKTKVYECEINDWNDKLERTRRKKLEDSYWHKRNVEFLREDMRSLGVHTHPNSDYEHEILVCDDWRIWKAMEKLIDEKKDSLIETVIDEGWRAVYDDYKNRVEYDFWDLRGVREARGDNWDIGEVLYEIVKYAKSHGIDIDTAITALELKKDENFQKKIRDAFLDDEDQEYFEIVKNAYEAVRGD